MPELNQVRAALLEIDTAIHNLWDLGRNIVVGWTTDRGGIQVALAPCYRVMGQASARPRFLDGPRRMNRRTFREACKLLQARVLNIALPFSIADERADRAAIDAIDSVISRYSIIRTEHRAVILFETVGFATASPVEQMAQFVSLEHSLGTVSEQMSAGGLPVELARSTAGDGALFVWNRHAGLDADLRTYVAMILALLDNRLARTAAGMENGIVPLLRTTFAVGSHYSYHQVEANRPRMFEYATGQVTISLARLAANALPEQILIGSFERPVDGSGETTDTVHFVARAEALLAQLTGCSLGEYVIRDLRSLIGSGPVGTARGIIRYSVADKHGQQHEGFNLRARATFDGAPIEIGRRTDDLAGFDAKASIYEIPSAGGSRPLEPATP